ncbi:deoxynucleoside triphosphate triphosphohydrolase samhd1 like protein [Quercus suber]|uniref:Deoxynucleoside triphosphate triphosphohydrolase samhd1 like protein n=1 Tax=Quercus suber TaxID=58331 RepID=A0AAW0KGL8_QUESU
MGLTTNFEDSTDRRLLKQVHDNVHGNIYLEPISLKFIDTEELRELKQLGLSNMVYPGAVHSRFEHSLGVYWLAGKAVDTIKTCQGLELGIERSDIKLDYCMMLAMGHSATCLRRSFFLGSHEDMSVKMVDHIVDEHNIDIDPDSLTKVKQMIIASSEHGSTENMKEKKFLYDIVANGRNGIDVDKFDYIVRDSRACGLGCNFHFERLMESMQVMGDEICYRAKDYLTIHKLFATRADLHRTAIELMVVDALLKANDSLDIASSIHQPAEFWKLDDTILKIIEISNTQDCQELKEARDIIQRIRRRELYQFCNEFSVPKDKMEHFKTITPQDIICSQKTGGVTLEEEDIVVSNVKIDLTRGRNNPLQSDEVFSIQDDRISHLLPAFYQDMIVRVYSKKPELVEAVSEAFENFQLKTYGKKAQVHSTPDSKKQRRR